jgi:hypothetical protein
MRRLADYASDGRKAYRIIGALFDNIVVALRRNPRIHAAVSRDDLELLVSELRGRVALSDIGEDL